MKLIPATFLTCLLLNPGIHTNAYHIPGGEQGQNAQDPGQPDITKRFFSNDAGLQAQVDSVYNSLSNKQRAAQMIMTASSTAASLGYPYSRAKSLVQDGFVGNIVFLKGSTNDFRKQTDDLNALGGLRIKPLFACDCEPSLMNGKWSGSSIVKKANQQKTVEDVRSNTAILNKDIKQVGVQLNFAPVADNAKNKEVISSRAFGNNAESIIKLSNEFIRYTQNDGIAASLKHFPGHGAVKGDSHKESVYIDGELKELNTFKSIIQSPTPPLTVMVGHIVVKNNLQYQTNGLPATLSPVIITKLLRNELKYQGIITTDALNMLAAAKVSNADWRAVEAGVDLVLMPKNPVSLNKKIADALEKDDALSSQIAASVKRIIRLKIVLGII